MADKKISALTAASTPLAGTEVLPIVQSGATVKVAVSDLTAGRAISASGGTFKASTAYGTVSSDNTGTTGGGAFSMKQNGVTSGIIGVSGAIRGDTSTNLGLFSETGKSIEIFVNGDATAVGSFTTAGNYAPASGKGVNFTANTPAAGMTSQLLNWYEEGTWTPVLRGSGTAGTYETSTNVGRYTRVGRQVTIDCLMIFAGSITGGGTGYAQITGLPFAMLANSGATGAVVFEGVDWTAGANLTIRPITTGSTSTLYFVETNDNAATSSVQIAGFSATDRIAFTLTYFV